MNQLHLDTLNRILGSDYLCRALVCRIIGGAGKPDTAYTILDPAHASGDHLECHLEAMAREFAKQHHKNDPSKPNPSPH